MPKIELTLKILNSKSVHLFLLINKSLLKKKIMQLTLIKLQALIIKKLFLKKEDS